MPEEDKPKIYLLEFDKRFGVFPEFIQYDFRDPLKLPREIIPLLLRPRLIVSQQP
jgi:hypothetical protein